MAFEATLLLPIPRIGLVASLLPLIGAAHHVLKFQNYSLFCFLSILPSRGEGSGSEGSSFCLREESGISLGNNKAERERC